MSGEAPVVKLDYLGGNCPVQAEGRVDGVPFYFRARGSRWSMAIGPDVDSPEVWSYGESFGQWPDAGWMSEEEAAQFIAKAAALWRAAQARAEAAS